MLLLRKIGKLHFKQSLYYSDIKLDYTVRNDLENEKYKPKNHPGVVKPRCIDLPEHISAAIRNIQDEILQFSNKKSDFPIKQLIVDGAALHRFITSRHVPIEVDDIYRKRRKLRNQIVQGLGYNRMSEIDPENTVRVKEHINQQVDKLYYDRTYAWKPIIYDDYKSLSYAIGRSALEYSTVRRVFNEIAQRHSDFKPRSFFDFGAGVGTGTWAASQLWGKSLYEYFLVDSSREMNNLSDLILRNGDANKSLSLKTIYHRQFLPVSTDAKFDLILSAYTLMELPDLKTRIETLLTLWNKCDGYLVLIEPGTNAGFSLINEARDFLMNHLNESKTGYVYAPCPHEEACPRVMDAEDKTPCNFFSRFNPLRVGDPLNTDTTKYSYLVLKKGLRSSEDASIDWPRFVRATQVRSRHTICHMCTHRGKLERHIVTPTKHSKLTYSCSRKTECGDRLPVLLLPETESRDCDDDSNHDNKNEDCDSDSNHDNKNENCSMPAIK